MEKEIRDAPEAPNRLEFGRDEENFRTKANRFLNWMYDFSIWIKDFVPYVRASTQGAEDTMKAAIEVAFESKQTQKNADIAARAKNTTIEKAQEANSDAKEAHLSALYASERAEHADEVSGYVDDKKIEIVGIVDEHREFVAVSTNNIDKIKTLLLRRANETAIARDEAVASAITATGKAKRVNEQSDFVENSVAIVKDATSDTMKNRDTTKRYRDETLSSEKRVIGLKNQTADYEELAKEHKDRCEVIYSELKDVGSAYQIHKELYIMRTGTIFEVRGV